MTDHDHGPVIRDATSYSARLGAKKVIGVSLAAIGGDVAPLARDERRRAENGGSAAVSRPATASHTRLTAHGGGEAEATTAARGVTARWHRQAQEGEDEVGCEAARARAPRRLSRRARPHNNIIIKRPCNMVVRYIRVLLFSALGSAPSPPAPCSDIPLSIAMLISAALEESVLKTIIAPPLRSAGCTRRRPLARHLGAPQSPPARAATRRAPAPRPSPRPRVASRRSRRSRAAC